MATEARERIAAVALQEFAARGYHGASTTEIATLAGVSQPSVHYHFGSKDALYDEVVSDAADRWLGGIRHAVPPAAGTVRERLAAYLVSVGNGVARHDDANRLFRLATSAGDARYARTLVSQAIRGVRHVADIITALVGEATPSHWYAARALIALVAESNATASTAELAVGPVERDVVAYADLLSAALTGEATRE